MPLPGAFSRARPAAQAPPPSLLLLLGIWRAVAVDAQEFEHPLARVRRLGHQRGVVLRGFHRTYVMPLPHLQRLPVMHDPEIDIRFGQSRETVQHSTIAHDLLNLSLIHISE